MHRTTPIDRPHFLTASLAAAWRLVRWLWRAAVRIALLIALLAILGDGATRDPSLRAQATALARPYLFDYIGWEINALWAKAREGLLGVGPYLDNNAARAQVQDYFAQLEQVRQIEAQIETIYSDPQIGDPDAAAADLRAARDALRDRLAERQPLVESILESQVSAVLVDEGFGLLGQTLPPVSMHVTPVPMVLVVSPRDRIEFAVDLNLDALPIPERERLEARIDQELGVSSLVAPLGGLSMYPSMVVETESIARAIEVTAHEWAHHYLFFFPLGWEYSRLAETRILNETAATFFGREIALEVMARYYPDIPPPDYPSFGQPRDSQAQPGLLRLLRRLPGRAGRGRRRPDRAGPRRAARPQPGPAHLDGDHPRDHHPRRAARGAGRGAQVSHTKRPAALAGRVWSAPRRLRAGGGPAIPRPCPSRTAASPPGPPGAAACGSSPARARRASPRRPRPGRPA